MKPTLFRSNRFKRSYQKLTTEHRAAVDETLKRFEADPRHAGLHFEKLKGSDYRTIRFSLGMRIILKGGDGNRFDLIDVGPHPVADRYGRKKRR